MYGDGGEFVLNTLFDNKFCNDNNEKKKKNGVVTAKTPLL